MLLLLLLRSAKLEGGNERSQPLLAAAGVPAAVAAVAAVAATLDKPHTLLDLGTGAAAAIGCPS